MSTIAMAVVASLSGVVILQAGWWTLLALVALRRPAPRLITPGTESIVALVPAHNEELLIGRTVDSLQKAATHHQGAVRILVVADNCTDRTTQVAALHGAEVVVRRDADRRGKSYTLDYGLGHLDPSPGGHPDIVAVVDADTEVSREFFAAIAESVRSGAAVVQAHYAAGGGDEPVRRLRRLAFALVHWARPVGASRLGLGTSLKGNGMAFRWDIASEGIGGHGITEDAAMTLALARRGVAVHFEPRATVTGYMAGSWKGAAVQDHRWEIGRRALAMEGIRSLMPAFRKSRKSFGGVIEVLSPPFSVVALLAFAALAVAVVSSVGMVMATGATAMPLAYAVAGWKSAGVSRHDLASLIHAPRFVMGKALAMRGRNRRKSSPEWVRTGRSA